MELKLRKPELEDKALIDPYFRGCNSRSCEDTFANLYLWSRHYKINYAFVEDMLIFQQTEDGRYTSFPKGDRTNLKKVLDELMLWYEEQNLEFHLMNVTQEQFGVLEEL